MRWDVCECEQEVKSCTLQTKSAHFMYFVQKFERTTIN